MGIAIPKQDSLLQTHEDDPYPYYYKGATRWFYRKRLEMVMAHLDAASGAYGNLLDVGFGSGILVPEECRRARHVAGIDLHDKVDLVRERLAAQGVHADLKHGSIDAIPCANASQDAVVCLSVLEHLHDLDRALREIRRVMRPGAVFAVGFPVKSRFTGLLFASLGFEMDHIHPSSHTQILDALHRHFDVTRVTRFPGLFVSAQCRPPPGP